MTSEQLAALRYIAMHEPCTTQEVGRHVYGAARSARSASARGFALIASLVKAGYVGMVLTRMDSYEYRLSQAGRDAL